MFKINRYYKITNMLYIFAIILCAVQGFIPKSHRSCSPLHSLFGLWNAAPEQYTI